MKNVGFDFYGFRIRVESSCEDLLEHVRRDFAYFVSPDVGPYDLRIESHLDKPDYDSLPDLEASLISPRNVVYRTGQSSFVDYFGNGLLTESPGSAVAVSLHLEFLREMHYLYILSKVGLHLDTIKHHRLHAAALCYRDLSVLLLCPSGGGKSTTTLNLLKLEGYRMLSEDSPLVDGRGWIHSFPLCLGCKGEPPDIPSHYIRKVSRMEFDPKNLIDLEYFGSAVGGEPCAPGLVFVGLRHSGVGCRIEPMSKARFFRVLVRDMVIGMGLYQGIEFLFQSRAKGLARHALVVLSRARNAWALASGSCPYFIRLGRDIDLNVSTLHQFVVARRDVGLEG